MFWGTNTIDIVYFDIHFYYSLIIEAGNWYDEKCTLNQYVVYREVRDCCSLLYRWYMEGKVDIAKK